MSKKIDLTGQKFGRLTVLYEIGPREDGAGIEWACKCECGNLTVGTTQALRLGEKKSCGCMRNRPDLTGQKFGRLTVLHKEGSNKGEIYWHCKCECGNWTTVTTNNLRKGAVKSCGCMKKELTATNGWKNIYTRIFDTYHNLRRACYDETSDRYRDFGAKGISFCKEWLDSVDAFKEWSIQNGYTPRSKLLRYDQDKGYSPDNCYWWERTAEKTKE